MLKWYDGMLGIPGRATQVGILTRKGNEVHIVIGTVLGIVFRQCHHSSSARGIVVGTGIEDFLAQVAQMIIMRSEDITTVVPLALYLGNDVEAFIVFQKLVVYLCMYLLHALYGLWRYPQDGFVDHLLSISLEELDGGFPRIDEARIRTFACFLQTGEVFAMTVGEPEFACHQTVLVFWLGQVGKHLF